ncbi:polyadenylation and cleavage factor4 [Abeliophyllum distichum]|uniref:ATP-dependent DNA helicase n=1 Tax=Abeliophyllum distichum TaxID=126358 RepID=A0ABD1QH74_9LAMI
MNHDSVLASPSCTKTYPFDNFWMSKHRKVYTHKYNCALCLYFIYSNKAVRIIAPTGVAAFNIGSATIHHELAISAEKKPSQPYIHISGDQCIRMQEDFKDTKLIIIDEYSMLRRAMTANVDLRCWDIFTTNESFGGVSIILVGDMRPLPPVFDSPLYSNKGSYMQQCGTLEYSVFDKCIRLLYIFRQARKEQRTVRSIADAICARIIEVPAEQKLPSLYLLDSIVKNIGGEYVKYFSARLPEVFREAYARVQPNMHPVMCRLFDTCLIHGVHVNPKYLESQHQFGRSTVDTVGAEGLSSSTYGIGPDRSLSPSLDEFDADILRRQPAERASHSHSGFGYGLRRVMGRDEKASEWRARNWHDASSHQLINSAVYSSNNGVDLRGPRALIDAYGIDEREKEFNLGHPKVEYLDVNGVDQKASIKTWQNTEEDEFDWEDMSPTLGDQSRHNELHSSYVPLNGNLTARYSFATHHAAPFASHSRSSWSKTQFSSATDSSVVKDVPHSSGHGVINKITGLRKPTSQITASSSARESWKSPDHLNSKGGGSYSGTGSFSSACEVKPTIIGNFPSADGKFCRRPDVVSTISSMFDSLSPEIPSADAPAVTESWLPANLHSSYPLSSLAAVPSQVQMRGQFNPMSSGNVIVDQGLNKSIHSKQRFGGTNSMAQSKLPQFPSQHPGLVPLNLQSSAQAALVQPHLLMSQGVRLNLLPSSAPDLSHAIIQPLNDGYAAQWHGPPGDTALHNVVLGVQSSLPINNAPNTSIHLPGVPLPSLPRGLPLGTTQSIPIPQNIGQLAPSPPAGGALSGLISSLVAQGLISLTKQDSVGVVFDQDLIKERHESAITALYADLPRQCTTCGLRFISQEEHSKHMDWHVNKNRTLKNRKTKPSPSWFVSISMWLHGAEALGTEAVPGFLSAQNIVEKKKYKEMAVPADENQTACALCGEPFDDFYSDEMDEWMYKGAVYMNSPAGSFEGMNRSQLGSIVHAKCRSDSHVIPIEDFTKDEGELTEEGIQRKKDAELTSLYQLLGHL